MLFAVAALVFVAIVMVVVGTWWALEPQRRLRRRLAAPQAAEAGADLLLVDTKANPSRLAALFQRSDLLTRLESLSQQAGSRQSALDVGLVILAWAGVAAVAGWWRTGSPRGALLSAILGGLAPVGYLLYKRSRRLGRFQEQFADAVDMMARSIRAGNALTAAIQLVGDEMADPVRDEFRQVSEEIRLGVDPSEALEHLQRRVPTEDVRFFCSAVGIQRTSGGNLAEILDRLSDVIRKRYELLSHARVLSSQQRYAAIFVGTSPVLFSIVFYFLYPGYFDPLIASPSAPMLLGAGFVLQVIGFAVIWRLARIKV